MLLQSDVSGSGQGLFVKPDPLPLPPTRYTAWKAVLDLTVAACLLILTLPVILVTALLVRLTSRGPAFYTQTRLGRQGRPFTIYKLRTMTHNCERVSGPRWSSAGDSRITRLGQFLRKTHLDELPQLWNVIRGDMSLVGPRPERPEFVPGLEKSIPHYRDRMLVRPGVTGLAQIQLAADTDLESVRRKLAYDLYYIRQMGFWLDLRIVVGTGLKMFGVSFSVLGKFVLMPSGAKVEHAYRSLPARPEVRPQPQPA